MIRRPPRSTLFPTRRSSDLMGGAQPLAITMNEGVALCIECDESRIERRLQHGYLDTRAGSLEHARSEEHTSELQSRQYLVCRLLLEKKKKNYNQFLYVYSDH